MFRLHLGRAGYNRIPRLPVVIAFGFAVMILLNSIGLLNPSPSSSIPYGSNAATTGLPSWNPNVKCSATLVTFQDIFGSSYPEQNLSASQYQTTATSGGVPDKRGLSLPCSITNIYGRIVTAFVEVHNLTLQDYFYELRDCTGEYDAYNGGGPYPNGEYLCDSTGNLVAPGTTYPYIHVEIDHDWMAAGYAGPSTSFDNNDTIDGISPPCTLAAPCSGSISIDVQGFVYWDPEQPGAHWEIHPLTAWRFSPTNNTSSTSTTSSSLSSTTLKTTTTTTSSPISSTSTIDAASTTSSTSITSSSSTGSIVSATTMTTDSKPMSDSSQNSTLIGLIAILVSGFAGAGYLAAAFFRRRKS